MKTLVFVYLLYFGAFCSAQDGYSENPESRELLKKRLFQNYNKTEKPRSNNNDTTFISLEMSPHYLIDLDEKKSLFHMYTWFSLSWFDDRLKWDVHENGEIGIIRVADSFVWQPVLRIYNGVNSHIDPMRDSHVHINYSGSVTWYPPAEVTAYCDVAKQVKWYPNDIHICKVSVFSPTYHGFELHIKKPKLLMGRFYNTHPIWEILPDRCTTKSIVEKYDCCSEYFRRAEVTFVLKRRLPAHLQVVRLPCIVLMALTLSMFWLPSDSGKKIIVGALAIVGLIILIIYAAASTESPRAVFLAVQPFHPVLLAITSAVLLEIFVLNLARICGSIESPQSFADLLSGSFGRYLGVWMPRQKSTPLDEIQLHDTDIKAKSKNAWLLIATFLDRVLFGVFVIVFTAIHWS